MAVHTRLTEPRQSLQSAGMRSAGQGVEERNKLRKVRTGVQETAPNPPCRPDSLPPCHFGSHRFPQLPQYPFRLSPPPVHFLLQFFLFPPFLSRCPRLRLSQSPLLSRSRHSSPFLEIHLRDIGPEGHIGHATGSLGPVTLTALHSRNDIGRLGSAEDQGWGQGGRGRGWAVGDALDLEDGR